MPESNQPTRFLILLFLTGPRSHTHYPKAVHRQVPRVLQKLFIRSNRLIIRMEQVHGFLTTSNQRARA